ncbi:hypothetical protein NE237_023106 [Protea cynaroides]|uniref:Uncharacterized protein n=1 Tax=Protea cynaroides TaxID=273540 RepID=A0A9Q0K540_9MAGN|nr:hypothetical protein NE237_023106 [Protea cynaroides]
MDGYLRWIALDQAGLLTIRGRGIRDECYREERLRSMEPEEDKGCIDEFKDLREVEDVSPEEDGTRRWGVRWEAEDPTDVMHLVSGGDSASDGHGEGEDEEDEVVDGGDEAEERWDFVCKFNIIIFLQVLIKRCECPQIWRRSFTIGTEDGGSRDGGAYKPAIVKETAAYATTEEAEK